MHYFIAIIYYLSALLSQQAYLLEHSIFNIWRMRRRRLNETLEVTTSKHFLQTTTHSSVSLRMAD